MCRAQVAVAVSHHDSSTAVAVLIDVCLSLQSLGLSTTRGGKVEFIEGKLRGKSVPVPESGNLHTSLTSRSFQVLLLIFIGLLPKYFPFCSRKALSMSILKIGPYPPIQR